MNRSVFRWWVQNTQKRGHIFVNENFLVSLHKTPFFVFFHSAFFSFYLLFSSICVSFIHKKTKPLFVLFNWLHMHNLQFFRSRITTKAKIKTYLLFKHLFLTENTHMIKHIFLNSSSRKCSCPDVMSISFQTLKKTLDRSSGVPLEICFLRARV